ncbi:hypothetical protein JG687_00001263 [Phytophthora cactorum]|uniref:Uncharacterized protein n=1 Tax=Phytophthora cactorum TaxID=29920 RepID=A0A8T1V0C7_9STRA|nr:hypothetical protein GQ600_5682 [Phytophthora cactorum]KAG6972803.1 hypothetical protein JG687_00001263 [Phytophthora cactorum]
MDTANDGTAKVESLQSKWTNTSTKRTYLSKANVMTTWLASHYPATIDGSIKKIRVPLPNDAALRPFCPHLPGCSHV